MSTKVVVTGAGHLTAMLDNMAAFDVEAALNECGNIIEETAKELLTLHGAVDSGQLIGSIRKGPVEGNSITVGTNVSYAPYVEYGTGIYAGNGSGYWVFVKGNDSQGETVHKRYTLQQAKQLVAIMRSKGLDAYYTNGQKPQPYMHPALENNRAQFEKVFDHYIKEAAK